MARVRSKTRRSSGQTLSEPLRYPPLSQVVFEANFQNSFAVETRIAEYQQRLESVYPNSGAEYIVRFPTAVPFGKPPKEQGPGLTPIRTFVFQNQQGSRIARVSVVNFAVIVTDYLHFQDYRSSLKAALEPAIEIFQLHNVERIGLRYINQLSIPSKGAETHYQKYVKSPISSEAVSPHIATNFLTEMSIDLEDAKRLTIRSGLLPRQPDEQNRTYLLDFDCYSLGNVSLSSENLDKLLVQYHEAIEATFVRSVTEKYWRYMAEGTPL